jgi:hypothetical protein
VFKDAEAINAPWLDPADIVRRGALVIASDRPPATVEIAGRPSAIEDVRRIDRPLTRGRQLPPTLWLGAIPPQP